MDGAKDTTGVKCPHIAESANVAGKAKYLVDIVLPSTVIPLLTIKTHETP
jgi:hypothetical protein